MTGGSDDARTPNDEPNAVDAAWDALVRETGKADEDVGPDAATSGAREADPDDEMARLMSGAAPKLPVIVDDTRRLQLEAERTAELAAEAARSANPEIRPVDLATRAAAPARAGAGAPAATPAPAPAKDRGSRASVEIVVARSPSAKQPVTEEDQPARASRPTEPGSPPAAPAAARPLPWAWIGVGALGVGVVVFIATGDARDGEGRAARRAATADQGSPVDRPERADPTPPRRDPRPGDVAEPDVDGEHTGPGRATSSGGRDPPTRRTLDPREPPPGTPPEIAAVFRRLPVSPSDRPPVGGIGANGIHIDHIAMGSETTGATCSGRTNDFSVERMDRAGVCVRVVHPREKDELQVLWQKHGGSTRRSKMVVLPMHAYRTRGYLVLRSEYIGDWTVRILSSDGVELASHDFTVVP